MLAKITFSRFCSSISIARAWLSVMTLKCSFSRSWLTMMPFSHEDGYATVDDSSIEVDGTRSVCYKSLKIFSKRLVNPFQVGLILFFESPYIFGHRSP